VIGGEGNRILVGVPSTYHNTTKKKKRKKNHNTTEKEQKTRVTHCTHYTRTISPCRAWERTSRPDLLRRIIIDRCRVHGPNKLNNRSIFSAIKGIVSTNKDRRQTALQYELAKGGDGIPHYTTYVCSMGGVGLEV